MRKVKLNLQCKVPSWNFCNYDGPTPDDRFSKDKCRFCVSTKAGKRCVLYDKTLAAEEYFIHKVPECIEATAGYVVEVDEPVSTPQVSPQTLIRETIKEYNKMLNDLLKQGYPRALAESIATKHMTGGI